MAVEQSDYPIWSIKQKTTGSKEFMDKAKTVMPGGLTANIKYFEPHPIVMKQGNGSKIIDVDGNEYIDYLMSYGSLITGHGHENVKAAMMNQMEKDGTWLFGTPHGLEVEMGERLKHYFPSMERVRYTNSGTEATLLSLRLAAAHTGKHKIAKFEGHYHGGYDQMLLSINPPVEEAGREEAPEAVPESKGMHPSHQQQTLVLPFNDLKACEALLQKHQHEIGAVMLEPVQGGIIPAEVSFLQGLKKLTEDLGMVLIFDEVKTGFRTGLGGAQQTYGVEPDLTTLGKVIGAGFPIGVVGGKKEIMMHSAPDTGADVFDSSQSKHASANDVLFHSGTYNGHPMILAAGLAVMDELEEKMEQVLGKTEKLKQGIDRIFSAYGVKGGTIGIGSIFSVLLTEKENIRNYRDLQSTNLALKKEIDYRLLEKGIYTKPMSRYSLSTAHTDEDIEQTLDAYEQVISRVFGGSPFHRM
ncbi:aspartate aminotransferase family protein [Salibacterium aidingense]|uniref:aspartate aminotransferase family protein n=1 Tax=Salibacterium aidingense TaxID=384933 RepID=UPI003BC968F5